MTSLTHCKLGYLESKIFSKNQNFDRFEHWIADPVTALHLAVVSTLSVRLIVGHGGIEVARRREVLIVLDQGMVIADS